MDIDKVWMGSGKEPADVDEATEVHFVSVAQVRCAAGRDWGLR